MFKPVSLSFGAAAFGLVVGFAQPAVADAHANASCIGFEASGIAPAGSSDEFPGGPAELQAYLREAVGHPTGAIISEVAHQHLGSHEACDAGE
jgi:hypothetical protein